MKEYASRVITYLQKFASTKNHYYELSQFLNKLYTNANISGDEMNHWIPKGQIILSTINDESILHYVQQVIKDLVKIEQGNV